MSCRINLKMSANNQLMVQQQNYYKQRKSSSSDGMSYIKTL